MAGCGAALGAATPPRLGVSADSAAPSRSRLCALASDSAPSLQLAYARWMDHLRSTILVALGLACAAPVVGGCKKAGDAIDDVEAEQKPKPKPKEPESKPEPPFEPKGKYHGFSCGSCPCDAFCAAAPEIVTPNDDPKRADPECGRTAKVPSELGSKHTGAVAWFSVQGTKNVRPEHPKTCCYTYQTGPCGKGRPVRDGEAFCVADTIASDAWTRESALEIDAIAPEVRALGPRVVAPFAAHLRAMGALEHASIPAVSRMALDLVALGAPPDLIADAHVAALDEVRHARFALGLAKALDGRDESPGPLPLPVVEPGADVAKLAIETVVDGCVQETIGSALIRASARACTVPSLARALAAVADDEERHGVLAFRVARFLIGRLAPHARAEVEATIRAVVTSWSSSPSKQPAPPELGLLDPEAERAYAAEALAKVVAPAIELLLATTPVREA